MGEMDLAGAGSRRLLLPFLAILLATLALRVMWLDLKPLHNDEGCNYLFTRGLYPVELADTVWGRLSKGQYRYDPHNYHGPFLYYVTLLPVILAGFEPSALRIMPALFGTLMLILLWPLRHHLGRSGVLTAALLLSLSPGLVYFSRYFIHEIFLVFFSFALLVTTIRYFETGMDEWIMLAGCAAGCVFSIKETWTIVFFSVVVAAVCTLGMRICFDHPWGSRLAAVGVWFRNAWVSFFSLKVILPVATGAMMAAIIGLTLYSSFFTHISGIRDSLRSLEVWTDRGLETDGHAKEFTYFLKLMAGSESVLLILGGLGLVVSLRRTTPWPMLFIGHYSAITLLVYSLVPYKTPWCLINVLAPLAVMGGYAVTVLAPRFQGGAGRIVALGALGLMMAGTTHSMIGLNFRHFDNEQFPYVYGHAHREVLRLVQRIQVLAAARPEKNRVLINAPVAEQWPLAYYLREFSNVKWWGKVVGPPDAPMVLAGLEQEGELDRCLKDTYLKERFHIRQGVSCVLYHQVHAGLGGATAPALGTGSAFFGGSVAPLPAGSGKGGAGNGMCGHGRWSGGCGWEGLWTSL